LVQGDFVFPDGAIYKGQYTKLADGNVCMQGEGTLQSGPESFKGVFELGKYKSGEYKSCNGATYVGSFRNNLFHGVGDYSWPDGRAYRGTWKDGKMHGVGHFQNFSFGADKEFRGYSVHGKFFSEAAAQETARSKFMGEYGTEYIRSAKRALLKIAEKTNAEVPEKFLVPMSADDAQFLLEENPDLKDKIDADLVVRAAIEDLVKPPFCAKGDISPEALKKFAESLAEESENPARITVVEAKNECETLGAQRIKQEQLRHVGQVVEFTLPDAEAPNFTAISLLNVGKEYDVEKAVWRIIFVNEAGPPVT
jgi:hypothetical protein